MRVYIAAPGSHWRRDLSTARRRLPRGNFDVRYNQWDLAAEPRAEIMSHPHLAALPPLAVANEISQSKAELEKRLGVEVVSFAYPYGDLNAETKALVQQAGFRFAVATDTGGLHLEDDRMQIFRINMFPHETTGSLFKKTAAWYRNYYHWKRGK